MPTSAYPRTRLFELLDRTPDAAAIWIAGPPGSGKTTLAADYTARRNLDCLWYQLDRGDSDPAAAFMYLTEAVRARGDDRPLPQYEPVYLGDLELFARTFFREVYRQTPPFLVFDNFQSVAPGSAHDIALTAMEELPTGGRIFVISNNDPPPKFAGLRARGQLAVIGWHELRLSLDECRGITATRDLRLTDADLTELHTRTQGWAAGLILLLQGLETRAVAISHTGGATPMVIFDYVAEIFEKLEQSARDFLLRAAYLPQVTSAMAEQIAPPGEARSMLRDLARSGFMLTVIQPEPQLIVQLHPLLREFLLAHAEATGSAAEITTRQLASAHVLDEHGHHAEAAALLIRIARWDELSSHIHRHAEALLAQGLGQTLEGWIRALPAQLRAADPWLQFWLGASRFPYAIGEARDLFAAAYNSFTRSEPRDVRGILATVNGMLEAILYDLNDYTLLDPWIAAGTELRAQLAEYGSHDMQARLVSNLFLAIALRQPDHPEFAEWRERTQQIVQGQREPNLQITAHSLMTLLYGWIGQFARGEALLDSARELLARPEVSAVSQTKYAQAESMFHMLSGDGQRCMDAARRGLEIIARSGVRLWSDTFLLNGLYGALANEDMESAADFLQQIEARPTVERRLDKLMYAYALAWRAALQGDTFIAYDKLRNALRTATEFGLPFLQGIAGIALSQVLFDSGDQRRAHDEALRAAALAAKIRNRILEFMTLMARARISLKSGQDSEGLQFLRSALEIGRERALVHFLWWHPQHVAYLCERALRAGIETDYVRRLIVRRNLMPATPPYSLTGWPWRYRLTLFGRFELSASDQDTAASKAGGRKPIELLQALAAFGGERVKLERIADALWPDKDSDDALRALNTTLHRLRKELLRDDDAVLLQAGELSLNRRYFWLDTWAFEQSADGVATLTKEPGDVTSRAELLGLAKQALTHYRGPLLADQDETWAAAPRERCRQRLLRLLTSTVNALQRAQDADVNVELYRLAAVSEPLSETITRHLMKSLCLAERTAEAIEAYDRLHALKLAELGTEPSPETQRLYRSIRTSIEAAPVRTPDDGDDDESD